MDKKTYIIGGVVAVILIIVGWTLFSGDDPQDSTPLAESVISRESSEEPVDVVLDFYNRWIDARHSTTTDPYQSGLSRDPLLSDGVRARVADAYEDSNDPVLCSEFSPEEVRTKVIFSEEARAQVLILPRVEGLSVRPLVTLAVIDDLWHVTDIECSTGESREEREFSFDREGFLLKQSVPAPFNSQHWHIVFEESGVMGHTAPLFFDGESNCRTAGEGETNCPSDAFREAKKVKVQGQMSEAGVEVKHLEILE